MKCPAQEMNLVRMPNTRATSLCKWEHAHTIPRADCDVQDFSVRRHDGHQYLLPFCTMYTLFERAMCVHPHLVQDKGNYPSFDIQMVESPFVCQIKPQRAHLRS